MRHVLILGGTGEARELALRLVQECAVTLSLAGRTSEPAPQAGRLRVGGFGGAEGLARYLAEEKIDVLVDATHPFAARISANATQAAVVAGVPLIVLERAAWTKVDGDRWIDAVDIAAAVEALGAKPRTVFLAIGRQEVGAFLAAPQHRYVVRSIEPFGVELPNCETILRRGPFEEEEERALMRERGIELVVAKNSGGDAIYGKIAAARNLGVTVVMVRRPPPTGAEVLRDVEEVAGKVMELHRPHSRSAERGE